MPVSPRFSIVIPLYNRADRISAVIAGLRGRFTGDFEVIVVDDGSHDGGAEAARQALCATAERGQVIEQANAGPGAARNAGVWAAEGEWIVFHDSDDAWYPWTLDVLARALYASNVSPPPSVVFFRDIEAMGGGLPPVEETAPDIKCYPSAFEAMDAGIGIAFGSCNLAIRRSVFEKIGGFDIHQRYGEDNDLIYRTAAQGPCVLILAPAMMALSRGLGDNLTDDGEAAIHGFSRILDRAQEGLYPMPPSGSELRARIFARIATKLVRRHYERGQIRHAYGTLLRYMPVWLRARAWHDLVRLPFAPALALLGGRNYGYIKIRRGKGP